MTEQSEDGVKNRLLTAYEEAMGRRKRLRENATRLEYEFDTLGEMLRHSVESIHQEDLAVCDPDRVWALVAEYREVTARARELRSALRALGLQLRDQ